MTDTMTHQNLQRAKKAVYQYVANEPGLISVGIGRNRSDEFVILVSVTSDRREHVVLPARVLDVPVIIRTAERPVAFGSRSEVRPSWPRWLRSSRFDPSNLREVAPGLYVGSEFAPQAAAFSLVVDLYGSSLYHPERYRAVGKVFRHQFDDGDEIPAGLLDTLLPLVTAALVATQRAGARHDQNGVLIHCQAGLSRSPSVAYALLRVVYQIPHHEALRRVSADPDGRFPLPATLQSAVRWADWKVKKAVVSG